MTDKEKLEELERNMHNAIEEYEDYQEEMLRKYCEGHNVEDLTIGYWECDNSPFFCVIADRHVFLLSISAGQAFLHAPQCSQYFISCAVKSNSISVIISNKKTNEE